MSNHQLSSTQSQALACFCFIAQRHRLQITLEDLLRQQPLDLSLSPFELVKKLSPHYWLRAHVFRRSLKLARSLPLPVMAQRLDGTCEVFVAKQHDELVAVNPVMREPRRYRVDELGHAFSGQFLQLKASRRMPERHRLFGMTWLMRRAGRMRGLLIQILVASLVMQVFATAMPLFSQIVIDKVLVHHNLSALYVLGTGMGLLTILEFVLMLLRTLQQAHIASKVELALGIRIKQKLLSLPLQYFQSRRSGHVLGLFKELDVVRQFVTGPSATSLVDLTFLVVFLPLMYLYSPLLTGVTMLTAVSLMGTSFLLKPGMARHMAEYSKATTECHGTLVEHLAGMATIKALAAEPAMQRRWESAFARSVLTTLRTANANGTTAAASLFIQRLSTLGILWVGAELALKNQISVGQMIAFQMLSARVLHPMIRLSQLWQELRQVAHSMGRLGDIMDAPSEEPSGDRMLIREPRAGNIDIVNLRFTYPGGAAPVLRDLTMHIPCGRVIALVGHSGSGKSTLVKLLQRLYVVERGSIRYNDIDLRNIELPALRRRLALVPQDAELFNGTIADNIAIHSPWSSLERIMAAARTAAAADFIDGLADGYQTLIGGQGVQLSGGQRQRIALARALLDEPDVLILDEATSALDYATEAQIHDNLTAMFRGRTLIIVTHRLHAVRHADTIHVLENGRLVESGTHDELLARRGRYRALCSLGDDRMAVVGPVFP